RGTGGQGCPGAVAGTGTRAVSLRRINAGGARRGDPAGSTQGRSGRQMSDQYQDLQQSYVRCPRQGDFIERSYEEFMASHPKVRELFATTDMGRQRLALGRGISVAIFHAAGRPLSRRATAEMACVHARRGRAPVDPALYPYWIESLLKVVAEADPEADEALLARWRQAMEVVCRTFERHYEAACAPARGAGNGHRRLRQGG